MNPLIGKLKLYRDYNLVVFVRGLVGGIYKSITMDDLFCYVNGKRVQLPPGRGECTLLEYIRGALLGQVKIHQNPQRHLLR